MMPDIDSEVIHANQEFVDTFKKAKGANPKSLRQLYCIDKDYRTWAENILILRNAMHNLYGHKTLILDDGVEL